MPLGLGIFFLHVILSITMDFNYAIFLNTPIFFLLLYYLTFGRKNYLTLYESK